MSLPSIPTTTREYRVTQSTGIEGLKLEQSTLNPPGDNEVLVKIYAVCLQFRDVLISNGTYPLGNKPNVVPGSDCAGEVLAVGAYVKGFKRGDRVSANFNILHIFGDIDEKSLYSGLGGKIDGVLTEYRAFPAESLVHIPELLSYEEASTLPASAVTAYNALNGPIPVKGGDVVLVQGTGGVSIFALQFAKASGATVIATTSSSEKAEVLKTLGADHIINYKETEDWDRVVLEITKGRGVDQIIEVGGSGTILKSFNCLKYAGWIHAIGYLSGFEDVPNLHIRCLLKGAYLRGILIGSKVQFDDMNRLIAANQIKPVIGKVFSFDEVPAAYEYIASQKHVGKVVVKIN